ARVGGKCRVSRTADGDVLLELIASRLFELSPPSTESEWELPFLLPMGLSARGETLYADWFELNHVLVAGSPGAGTDAIISGLVASLAGRRNPDELELWTIAERGQLAPQVLQLPHQR